MLALLAASSAILTPPTRTVPVPVVAALSDLRWMYRCIREGERPLRMDVEVEVRPTGDVRGQGLFAKVDLEEGVLINRYKGVWMTDEEYANSPSPGYYAFDLGNGFTVDGEDPDKSTFVRFINHSVRRANCEALQAWDETEVTGAVYLQTKRPIRKGEELLFDCMLAGLELWLVAESARSILLTPLISILMLQTGRTTGTSGHRGSHLSALRLTISDQEMQRADESALPVDVTTTTHGWRGST